MSHVLRRIVQLMYFMAPAYVANMAPPFLKYWKGWNPPINRRWLGTHKTVLGFAAGVLAAVLTAAVQSRFAWPAEAVAVQESWLGIGLRLGIGAMAGDAVKSFFKRRASVPSGERWVPFDQIDFIVGALVLVWPVASLSWMDAATLLIVSALGHILVNHIGYWLGVRPSRW